MKRIQLAVAAAAVLCAAVAISFAQDDHAKALDVGGTAPDFRLNDQDGKAARLQDLHDGHWVVVAFFPKALTPG
jgi:cytochrome oxidase Cu insertion factor (SCO1/SenC/PrrC family)